MGDGHHHAHGASATRAGARHAPRMAAAFGVIAALFVVEAVASVLTGSLALLSDAAHMLTDVLGVGMALAAITLAPVTPAPVGRTPTRSE